MMGPGMKLIDIVKANSSAGRAAIKGRIRRVFGKDTGNPKNSHARVRLPRFTPKNIFFGALLLGTLMGSTSCKAPGFGAIRVDDHAGVQSCSQKGEFQVKGNGKAIEAFNGGCPGEHRKHQIINDGKAHRKDRR